ncbi:MAG: hypothetical protein AB2693_21055, partial [Candidatus Thiodiazotropha sp.]
ENCVLTFVLNLKKENKLGQEFECPVCRLPSPAPEDEDVTIDWVRTMEPKADQSSKTKRELDDDDSEWCSQCKYVSKSEKSNMYCLKCRKYWCKSCSDVFHSFEITRNHSLIEIDNKQTDQLCSEALKLLHKSLLCSEHGDKPVEFCTKYGKKMCSTCIAENTGTQDVGSIQSLKDIVQDNSETESSSLLETATNIQNYVSEVIDVIKKSDHEARTGLDRIFLEVNQTKDKVIHLFEVLENNIKTEGKAIKKEIAIENEDKLNSLRDITRNLETVRYLLENFVVKISPEQAFLCIHEIKHVIMDIESNAMKAFSFTESKKVMFKTTEMLESLKDIGPNKTSLLASVGRSTSEIALPTYKQKSRPKNKRFEKRGVVSIIPFDKPEARYPTYNGVLFLPYNQYLLTESYYGFFCLLNDKKASVASYSKYYHKMNEIETSSDYFRHLRYATYMGNSILALGIPSLKKISFETADRQFTMKFEIDCARTPKALFGLSNGDLAISWSDPVAFGIITGLFGSYKENVYFTCDKAGRQLKSFDYVSIDEDREHVIQPCAVDKAVYCFDYEGQPIFKYIHEELKDPMGVGVDCEGNIYVCDKAGGIHVISPEGQAVCIIKEGCPETPLAIGFSLDRKSFAVTQYSGHYADVHFFSVISE